MITTLDCTVHHSILSLPSWRVTMWHSNFWVLVPGHHDYAPLSLFKYHIAHTYLHRNKTISYWHKSAIFFSSRDDLRSRMCSERDVTCHVIVYCRLQLAVAIWFGWCHRSRQPPPNMSPWFGHFWPVLCSNDVLTMHGNFPPMLRLVVSHSTWAWLMW